MNAVGVWWFRIRLCAAFPLLCLAAVIIDCHTLWGFPAVNLSFVLPFICFIVIIIYGHRSHCRG